MDNLFFFSYFESLNSKKQNHEEKIFLIAGIAAFAVAVALNINAGMSKDVKMDMALANVEALADGEYTEKIYNIYHRPDGTGHNCWSGGSESCL